MFLWGVIFWLQTPPKNTPKKHLQKTPTGVGVFGGCFSEFCAWKTFLRKKVLAANTKEIQRIGSQNILTENFFAPKIFWLQNTKEMQRICGHNFFASEDFFAQRKVLAAKYNGNAKDLQPQNFLRLNVFLRQKIFWLQNTKEMQRICGQNLFAPKNIFAQKRFCWLQNTKETQRIGGQAFFDRKRCFCSKKL